MRLFHVVLVSIAVSACRSVAESVTRRVEPLVAAALPREVSIAYEDLGREAAAYVQADVVMHAASTMKVAVFVELLRRAERGEIDLDGALPLENRFESVVDGSTFSLAPQDDSDPDLYAYVGDAVPARELARRMIVKSSNLATNVLLRRLTPDAVQATLEALGTRHMRVRRCLEDSKAFDAGIVNVITARDLALVMRRIADGSAFERGDTRDLALDVLCAQEFDDMIPAGVPAGTRVAHKTGDITRVRHDAAIVFPREAAPYVLVVLTRGFDDPAESTALVARISREVYDAHCGAGDAAR